LAPTATATETLPYGNTQSSTFSIFADVSIHSYAWSASPTLKLETEMLSDQSEVRIEELVGRKRQHRRIGDHSEIPWNVPADNSILQSLDMHVKGRSTGALLFTVLKFQRCACAHRNYKDRRTFRLKKS
jgi:hypothetical protein